MKTPLRTKSAPLFENGYDSNKAAASTGQGQGIGMGSGMGVGIAKARVLSTNSTPRLLLTNTARNRTSSPRDRYAPHCL